VKIQTKSSKVRLVLSIAFPAGPVDDAYCRGGNSPIRTSHLVDCKVRWAPAGAGCPSVQVFAAGTGGPVHTAVRYNII